jgi:hypothetical protein
MPDRFLNYLRQERRRLDCELECVQAQGADRRAIARLNQFRHIVDDQLIRWSADLTADRLAA